jgi:hypothetical protein
VKKNSHMPFDIGKSLVQILFITIVICDKLTQQRDIMV